MLAWTHLQPLRLATPSLIGCKAPLNMVLDGVETYIRSQRSLAQVAEDIKRVLRPENSEMRDGLNLGGGEYYLFEAPDYEIHLVSNRGEVRVEEMSAYNFYLRVYRSAASEVEQQLSIVSSALQNMGYETKTVSYDA